MAVRFYIMPTVIAAGIDPARPPTQHPKYWVDVHPFAARYYGSDDVCIVRAKNISTVDHDIVSAYPDVLSIPLNINNNLTAGAVTVAQNFLESLYIPADWVNTNRTYKQVLKIIAALFAFNEQWSKLTLGSSPFKENLDLTTQYNQLTTNVQNRIKQIFDDNAIDRSALTATSTLREGLKLFALSYAGINTINLVDAA